jgi:hypothetical protein
MGEDLPFNRHLNGVALEVVLSAHVTEPFHTVCHNLNCLCGPPLFPILELLLKGLRGKLME